MKRLKRIQLLAGACELDRLPGHRTHGERRTAARIAVHAGEHHAGQRHLLGEALGDVHGVLASETVHHEQDFGRRRHIGNRLHLVHQRLIDVEAARRIEHQHVEALELRGLQRAPGNVDRLLTDDDRQRRHICLRAKHGELFLRGRAIDVERRHQHLLALFLLEALGELRRGRRLARALKADHHDDRRGRHVDQQFARLGAERLGQRVGDDLDDHLSRRDRAQHVRPDGALRGLVHEFAHDRQRDVGFQQGDSHFAHGCAHVRLGERTAPTKLVEHTTEPIAQTIEHHHLIAAETAEKPTSNAATHNAPVGETSPTSVYPWTGTSRTVRAFAHVENHCGTAAP